MPSMLIQRKLHFQKYSGSGCPQHPHPRVVLTNQQLPGKAGRFLWSIFFLAPGICLIRNLSLCVSLNTNWILPFASLFHSHLQECTGNGVRSDCRLPGDGQLGTRHGQHGPTTWTVSVANGDEEYLYPFGSHQVYWNGQ